ncbi:hypothetical protein [Massilia sp. Leaf139]|uniref:hypothetical protein n=1 Tax=Massilia sp. Leaf139 TaxID=1736272 RepID=UPI0012E79F06|nr:hypothetical protein [Massilia sp. Leaf139]
MHKRGIFALLGQRERRELAANGDGSFATADRALSLCFREASEGTQIVLSVPRQSAMTGARGLRRMATLEEVRYGAEPALAQVVTESIEEGQVAAVGAPR